MAIPGQSSRSFLRQLRGLSQAELAARAGIRSNQVSRYETGKVLPQLPQLRCLLEALEVDLPTWALALDHVNRLKRLLAQQSTPGRQVAIHAVANWWSTVEEQHLDLCREVAALLEARLAGEASPPAKAAPNESRRADRAAPPC